MRGWIGTAGLPGWSMAMMSSPAGTYFTEDCTCPFPHAPKVPVITAQASNEHVWAAESQGWPSGAAALPNPMARGAHPNGAAPSESWSWQALGPGELLCCDTGAGAWTIFLFTSGYTGSATRATHLGNCKISWEYVAETPLSITQAL